MKHKITEVIIDKTLKRCRRWMICVEIMVAVLGSEILVGIFNICLPQWEVVEKIY